VPGAVKAATKACWMHTETLSETRPDGSTRLIGSFPTYGYRLNVCGKNALPGSGSGVKNLPIAAS